MQTYYKVLRKNADGLLTSIVAGGKAQVIYEPDKWIEPPEWLKEQRYGLLVFRTLEEAKDFAFDFAGVVIYEVKVQSPWLLQPMLDLDFLQKGTIKEYLFDTPALSVFTWPKGTLMVDWLKLEKEVWRYE